MPKRISHVLLYGAGIVVCLFLVSVFSPVQNVAKKSVIINTNETASEIAANLKNNDVIWSVFLFKAYLLVTGKDKDIIPGDYLFSRNISIAGAANRLAAGDYEMDQKKIVIPEGSTAKDIGVILKNFYPGFDSENFVRTATPYEGYLFPDSYEPFISTSSDDILITLRDNFDLKTKNLRGEAESRGQNWGKVVILASILEEEGKTAEDRKIISGILQQRLKDGVALQVDATFRYINGKTTKELTASDLKIDSPYNTYLYPGLPPTPISNPGLESLDTALNPEFSDYSYFLTGDDGQMHYSKSFEEHVENKRKYLQ